MTQWFCRDKILGMERNSYPTDLTSEQWEILQPLIPPEKPGGRPRKTNIREVVNAIFYLLRSGCAWRLLPHDFPPWQTVYTYFRKWKKNGTWKKIHDALHQECLARCYPSKTECGHTAKPKGFACRMKPDDWRFAGLTAPHFRARSFRSGGGWS